MKFQVLFIIIVLMRFVSSHIIKGSTNLLKNAIIFDNKMPFMYLDDNFDIDEKLRKSIYSMEHIFPRSLIKSEHVNDMHNIVKTINNLNIQRSNYKYEDIKDDDNGWSDLEFDNCVNHKKRLFIPNQASRGFISRAIMYMCKEYKYKINKVIDKDTLIKWYFDNPPSKYERYHNNIVKKLQNKNNVFISNYNSKKKDSVNKFFDTL